jgi:uncharacterized protein (DUF433 family)
MVHGSFEQRWPKVRVIVLDAAVLAGKPVFRGTRHSVEFIIGLMVDG